VHGVRIGVRSETKQVIALVTGSKAFITYEPKSLPGGVEDSKSKEELRGRKQELVHTESLNNSCGKDDRSCVEISIFKDGGTLTFECLDEKSCRVELK